MEKPKTFETDDLRRDFLAWSGGDTPDELDPERIDLYVDIVKGQTQDAHRGWDSNEVEQYLTAWTFLTDPFG